jgi:hypothetical protein
MMKSHNVKTMCDRQFIAILISVQTNNTATVINYKRWYSTEQHVWPAEIVAELVDEPTARG